MSNKNKLTPEIIATANTAQIVEKILALAKENDIKMTAEAAKSLYTELNKTGELSDDALETVSGGASTMYPPRGAKVKCPYCKQIIMANSAEYLDEALEVHIHSYHPDKV